MDVRFPRHASAHDDSFELTTGREYLPQFTDVAPYYDRLMSTVPYRMWVDYVELLLKMVECTPRHIVDLACGTGNVTFELARRGYEVTGVDVSEQMLIIARTKVSQGAPGAKFVQSDLRHLELPFKFDLATCLYDSLNYVIDVDGLRRVFERVRPCIRPGGFFIFDLNSVYALEQELFTQNNLAWAKTLRYFWKSHYDPETHISEVRMQFSIRGANGSITEFNEVHYERAYTIQEVEDLLQATGWTIDHIFDAYTTNRPRDDSERWFFIAHVSDE